MVISISKQIGLLIFSFISGIITGVFFDFYRGIRGNTNINSIVKTIEDILFWCLAGVVIFIFLLYNNCAFIGAYVYLWIVIGLYVYLFFVSKYVYPIFTWGITGLCKIVRIIVNTIVYPFKILIYKLKTNKKH